MNARPFVLLYGRDPQLLKTREWILETIGYPSRTVNHPEEFRAGLQDRSLVLAIICHSIRAEEAEAAIEAAHHQRPDLKVLVLVANPSMRLRKTGEHMLDTQEGPGLLIEAVQQLMAGRHDSDAGSQAVPRSQLKVVRLPVVPNE